jgi:hypothetical protein
MQPMARPSASVSASRRGEMPCRSHTTDFRRIDSMTFVATVPWYREKGASGQFFAGVAAEV